MTANQVISLDAIFGAVVKNFANEYLGRVEDVVINPVDGSIAYAMLTHGGLFHGAVGGKAYAVPFDAFIFHAHENGRIECRLDVSLAEIETHKPVDETGAELPDLVCPHYKTGGRMPSPAH